VDLLAALLVRQTPATFDELRSAVPAYEEPGRTEPTLMRMFERDKDELRRLGVPIETVVLEDGARSAYRLSTRQFYLPFLVLASSVRTRARTASYGYRSLGELHIEPDELSLLGTAAARVRSLGDAALTEEVDWAVRKLALDLPIGSPDESRSTAETIVLPETRASAETLASLAEALARRKRCSITYYSIERDDTSTREVEPYGLFFLAGQWYLAAHDVTRDGLRNFRVSRMQGVEVNTRNAQRADFELPPDFDLRAHARLQQPWELGTDDPVTAEVHFVTWTGATRAAANLGVPIEGEPRRRRYLVRRADVFTRWLFAFGGDVMPLSPRSVVAAFDELATSTARVYEGSA
jgi:predicted DNA-binding transcriptional regulator YafY